MIDLLAFWIILILIILAFIGVYAYFFCIAFVKQNLGDVNDVNSPINKPLEDYKDIIKEGIDYINNTPHKWVEIVSFDGLKLRARYYDNNQDKTIILVHGYRSSGARDFSCAVRMYSGFGFNVLLCDQRCNGRSEGRLLTFGVKESRDIVLWTEFINNKYSPESIILGGISMGATTVLLSPMRGLPSNVKGIIADCSFTSPEEIILKVAKDSFKINAKLLLPLLNLGCKLFGNFSIYGVSTLDSVKKFDKPILFIHGKSDNFVPYQMSERCFKECNRNGKLLLVENAGHGTSYLLETKRVESELKSFLNSCVS